ncbi:hypothetical protein [Actinoplanes sp. NPDC051494]|uniref:golvesin C-terminal-like domain-containing protein n=1 Tax=Actinoplanes sp. NPDC051494 TaxID=3363907 RepID=UPI0037B68AD3
MTGATRTERPAEPDVEHRASAALSRRSEYVRAFVEHAAARPASERATVRLPTLITVTALVAVGAVVVGVFWNLIKPMSAAQKAAFKGKAPASASAPPVVGFDAVAGWDCETSADRGFAAQGRTGQWRTIGTGGWKQDGCHGTFETLPLPSKEETATQAATWSFTTGKEIRSCQVSVYVPQAPGTTLADRAEYTITTGTSGTPYANFTLDQRKAAGTWVKAGTFPVHQNQIAVRLDAKDVTGVRQARIVFAQMRVNCAS